jgi:hypothetical protein
MTSFVTDRIGIAACECRAINLCVEKEDFTPYEVACYALYTVSSHVDVVGWDIHVQIVIALGNIPVT